MSALKSWIDVPKGSHFSLRNIPFGIITTPSNNFRRPAVAIGSSVVDLKEFATGGGFAELPEIHGHLHVFGEETLNSFAALGRRVTNSVRLYLSDVLTENTKRAALLRDNAELRKRAVLPQSGVTLHLPMRIGDYTDFYAGLRHAFTVGTILRGADKALQPNYKHMPVAYHGRASSIVVSGTPIRRPRGQIAPSGSTTPSFSPCKRLDIELEIAALLGKPSEMGTPVSVADASEYVFGYVLMNDWSARDIQAWEYVPLGPFTAKNFGTTISPWVVLADALEPHQAPALPNENTPLPYLVEERKDNVLDIQLEVELQTASGSKTTLTRTSSSNLLWSFPQMIAHHTITGCNLGVGDLLGSGTISGTEKGTQGSLLEATEGGKQPLQLPGSSETRTFLEDGDVVTITGRAGDNEGEPSRKNARHGRIVFRDMSDSPNCQVCLKIMSIFGPQDDGMVECELGRLPEIISMPCPHSESIRKIWESRWPYKKLPENCSVMIQSFGPFDPVEFVFTDDEKRVYQNVDLVAKDEPEHPGTSILIDEHWIDPSIPKSWYSTCLDEHGPECQEPTWITSQPGISAHPDWLIDVVDQCLVPYSSADTAKYITLSYTWGKEQRLKNTTGTLKELREIGALRRCQAPNLPRTIRDAMGVTNYLGERYLWVDSLCIIQDSDASLSRNVNDMHWIYANSALCLVADAGTDANYGLRGIQGISAPRCVTHVSLEIGHGEMLSCLDLPRILEGSTQGEETGTEPVIEGSAYQERGWTYQEFVFSKRRLIFSDGPLRWICTNSQWGEETLGDLERGRFTSGMPDTLINDWRSPSLDTLGSIISDYNSRYFTYRKDTLRAFLGTQNYLNGTFCGGLNYGHPEMFFDISLIWRAGYGGLTRRIAPSSVSSDEDFLPSWSWMGWKGLILLPNDHEYSSKLLMNGNGFTESVTEWFAMQFPPPLPPSMRLVNCKWNHYKSIFASGAGRVSDGWEQIITNAGPKRYRLRADTWKSEWFNYAIPLPASVEASRPIKQLQFLFSKTTRCHFSTRQVVMPAFHRYPRKEYYVELCSASGEFAGFLDVHHTSDVERFLAYETVELVSVVKGWTTDLDEFLLVFKEQEKLMAMQSTATAPPPGYTWPKSKDKTRHECYFVLCVQWKNGIAERQASGKVFAEVWERNKEDVDLVLG